MRTDFKFGMLAILLITCSLGAWFFSYGSGTSPDQDALAANEPGSSAPATTLAGLGPAGGGPGGPVLQAAPPTVTRFLLDGETLASVARSEGFTLTQLQRLNPHITDPLASLPGQLVHIPEATAAAGPLQNMPGRGDTLPDRPGGDVAVASAGMTEYTIVSGDSLWKIAQRQYGSRNASRMIEEIKKANRDIAGVQSGNLKIGVKINLPPAPPAPATASGGNAGTTIATGTTPPGRTRP